MNTALVVVSEIEKMKKMKTLLAENNPRWYNLFPPTSDSTCRTFRRLQLITDTRMQKVHHGSLTVVNDNIFRGLFVTRGNCLSFRRSPLENTVVHDVIACNDLVYRQSSTTKKKHRNHVSRSITEISTTLLGVRP